MPHHYDLAKPVQDNAHRAPRKNAKEHHKGMKIPTEHQVSHSPQASSLPGQLSVIKDPHAKPGMSKGLTGIIQSTTTSPETRQRLISGILDVCTHHGVAPQGPVHTVLGQDSTAYNSGMVHIAGAPSHHKKK